MARAARANAHTSHAELLSMTATHRQHNRQGSSLAAAQHDEANPQVKASRTYLVQLIQSRSLRHTSTRSLPSAIAGALRSPPALPPSLLLLLRWGMPVITVPHGRRAYSGGLGPGPRPGSLRPFPQPLVKAHLNLPAPPPALPRWAA